MSPGKWLLGGSADTSRWSIGRSAVMVDGGRTGRPMPGGARSSAGGGRSRDESRLPRVFSPKSTGASCCGVAAADLPQAPDGLP